MKRPTLAFRLALEAVELASWFLLVAAAWPAWHEAWWLRIMLIILGGVMLKEDGRVRERWGL